MIKYQVWVIDVIREKTACFSNALDKEHAEKLARRCNEAENNTVSRAAQPVRFKYVVIDTWEE